MRGVSSEKAKSEREPDELVRRKEKSGTGKNLESKFLRNEKGSEKDRQAKKREKERRKGQNFSSKTHQERV